MFFGLRSKITAFMFTSNKVLNAHNKNVWWNRKFCNIILKTEQQKLYTHNGIYGNHIITTKVDYQSNSGGIDVFAFVTHRLVTLHW